MSADSGESDGKCYGSFDVRPSIVRGAEDGQDQHECAYNLDAEPLSLSQVFVEVTHAHAELVLRRSNSLEGTHDSNEKLVLCRSNSLEGTRDSNAELVLSVKVILN